MRKWLDKGNINVYPMNEIIKTRNMMECKWVLLYSDELGDTAYHCVLCSSMKLNCLQEMMISGHALPMPKPLEYCLEETMRWGKDYDLEYYQQVLQMLAFTAQDNIPVNTKGIVSDAVDILVRIEVFEFYGIGSPESVMLLTQFGDEFDSIWEINGGSFLEVAAESLHYIQYRIQQLQHAPAPPSAPADS